MFATGDKSNKSPSFCAFVTAVLVYEKEVMKVSIPNADWDCCPQ